MQLRGMMKRIVPLLGLALLSACAATGPMANLEPPRLAAAGDRLAVDYTCRMADDRSLAASTLAGVSEDDGEKSPAFRLREKFSPIEIRVPESPEQVAITPSMSFEETIAMGISREIGTIPLDRSVHMQLRHPGYDGLADRDRYLEIAAELIRDRRWTIKLDEFSQRYPDVTPSPGMTVGAETDFPALVEEMTDGEITLYYSAKPGAVFPTGLGQGAVSEDGDRFRIRLTLQPGDLIRTGPLVGVVKTVGDKMITIDYGHPFGGRILECEVTAVPLEESLARMEKRKEIVPWVDDYEQGLALARKEGKPVVLLLYADWCKFCHRMFEETMPDALLDGLRSSFVWLRVNSDKNPEYGDRFGQQKFPMTVILDKDGNELAKLRGFQKADALRQELEAVLGNGAKTLSRQKNKLQDSSETGSCS